MKSIARYCGFAAVLAALTLVTACAGGNVNGLGTAGTGITPSVQNERPAFGAFRGVPQLGERSKRRGEARVYIRIPRKTSWRRLHPEYVPATTKSMTVTVAGVPTQIFNLTPSSTGCFPTAGYVTCSDTAFFPTGKQTITIALYDQTGGTGNVLSQASESVNVAVGAITNVAITLDGVPVTAQVLLDGSSGDRVPKAVATSVPVTVIAYDADQNIIMTPGTYASPITLRDSDATGATTLSAKSVKRPGEKLTLSYNGNTLSSAAITPSIHGAADSAGAATLTVVAKLTNLTLTEYDTPTGYSEPESITEGPDDAMWFVEDSTQKIGRIASGGTMTEYDIPNPPSQNNPFPVGITTGPDNALWFTESCGNKIGRITTQGAITEYSLEKPVGLGGTYPEEIVTGSDGALWFTQNAADLIGRITTQGVVAEYSVPTTGSFPYAITAGPDGALWFTECQGNKIGRITTAGTISEYSIPTASSEPSGIATGPDGALWFTESTTGKIGRITTSGTITEYTVDVPASTFASPLGITLGSDGSMWFTDYYTGGVGRITTFGSNSEFFATNNNQVNPFGIAAGQGGTLWITQWGSSQIGEITLPASASLRGRASHAPRTSSTGTTLSPEVPLATVTR
jgi:virginiamycin B lyase